MKLIKPTSPDTWLPLMSVAMVVLMAASPPTAVAQTVATVELVPVSTAGPSDTSTTLPTPLTLVGPGGSFILEVWARTDNPQGLSSVSTTVQFDPTLAIVSVVTHTALFPELPSGSVDNAAGFVAGLSGSHLSSCVDQVGVTPTWARVALLDMQATGSGSLVIQSADTGQPALGTAICGVGDLLPSQVAYGSATLTVTAPPIPTVSQWGLLVLVLLVLIIGSVTIMRQSSPIGMTSV